ncbi:hypothetical protein [Undibacterium sp.]|uniref:hypothetical protein n=1 Tax=Undibacterium sp. TaxID=1914977 RepID=UPI003750E3C7
MSNKLTEFEQGVFYAAAIVQITADQPGIAADIVKSAGLHNHDCSELDEMDKEALRVVNREKGMSLKGLN